MRWDKSNGDERQDKDAVESLYDRIPRGQGPSAGVVVGLPRCYPD
jgi:hypothetical protein